MDNDIAKMLFDQEMMRVGKDELMEAAKSIRMLYESFVNVGFNKTEALHLVSTILVSGLSGGNKQ